MSARRKDRLAILRDIRAGSCDMPVLTTGEMKVSLCPVCARRLQRFRCL